MKSPDEHEPVETTPSTLPDHGESVDVWDHATESVADILECADIAVEGIVERAEEQVIENITAAEERVAAETARRRAHLDRLRHELGARATTLALAYGEIADELEAVDRVLAQLQPGATYEPSPASTVTVRERHTFHFAGEVPAVDDDSTDEGDAPGPPVHNARVPWRDAA